MKKASGVAILPNSGFWCGLPGYIKVSIYAVIQGGHSSVVVAIAGRYGPGLLLRWKRKRQGVVQSVLKSVIAKLSNSLCAVLSKVGIVRLHVVIC